MQQKPTRSDTSGLGDLNDPIYTPFRIPQKSNVFGSLKRGAAISATPNYPTLMLILTT